MIVVAPSASISLARPIPVILPFSARIVSASRIGFSIAPLSSRPILRITSLVGPVACGASWAMYLFLSARAVMGLRKQLDPGLTAGSSWIIHLYTNELVNAIGDLLQGPLGLTGMSNFNLESVLSV